MTGITELAQSLKAAADSEMICRDVAETSEIWERTVTPENILALVEALEKAQQTEKTLESRNRRLDGIITAAEKRIAEVESRTVTVKPMRPGHITVGGEKIGIYMRDEVDEFIAALTVAGIKWETE